MNRNVTIIVSALIWILPAMLTFAESAADSASSEDAAAVRIEITDTRVTGHNLEIEYQITNDSPEDAWILVGHHGQGEFLMNADVFMTEDNHTLLIRKRLDLERYSGGRPSYGRYVRLRPGESQTEGILIKIPVQPASVTRRPKRQEQGLEYATRLAIELGYYAGNLREMTLTMLDRIRGTLAKGAFWFNSLNEGLTSRDDEILIPYNPSKFKGEKVLKAVGGELRIPYTEKRGRSVERDSSLTQEQPNLSSCVKVEIQYNPSMLEYFFPYATQQSLLSSEEREYLQTENTLVVEGAQQVKTIARHIGKREFIGDFLTLHFGGLVRYRRKLDLTCHYDDKPPMSFPIYDDDILVIGGDRYLCYEVVPSLRILTPQIQAMGLRMQCAANLKDLWQRLRFYCRTEATRPGNSSVASERTYPTPTEWCDAMLRPFDVSEEGLPLPLVAKWDEEVHMCPGAGRGKNHYAISPNCRFDSAPDTVLLFETKAGWNQHGGPELFTFDNHDPKGGCVLFNDGTVKFIRTKEQLHQLRWK